MADNDEFANVNIDSSFVALTTIEHTTDEEDVSKRKTIIIKEGTPVAKFQKVLGDDQTKALIAGGSIGRNPQIQVPTDYEDLVVANQEKEDEIARLRAELAEAKKKTTPATPAK